MAVDFVVEKFTANQMVTNSDELHAMNYTTMFSLEIIDCVMK